MPGEPPGPTQPDRQRWGLLTALGLTQITAWGSVYYLIAVLMEPLQAELHADKTRVVGAFTLALLIAGLLAPTVGAAIDRHGGRRVMTAGSLLAVAGLAALAFVTNVVQLYVVWALLGVAMAATLYDPAFAVLTQLFRTGSRRAIAVLTLFGGFASTVFWPLTAALIGELGWRGAVLVLAAINLAVCVPVHFALLPPRPPRPVAPAGAPAQRAITPREAVRDPTFLLVCLGFTGNAAVLSALGVHLLAMLQAKGLSAAEAAAFGALVGPMQVAGRLMEIFVGRRFSPMRVGIVAMALQPAALLVLLLLEPGFASMLLFATLYGAGNGAMTIVRGTMPAFLYGREHYGAINGLMAGPVLIARAFGPVAAAVAWAATRSYDGVVLVLMATATLSLVLVWLAVRKRAPATVDAA